MRRRASWPSLRRTYESFISRSIALARAGESRGFATWEERTPVSAEIRWMAVERERRHAGIGTAIIERMVDDLRTRGYKLALAMTSARPKEPQAGPDSYEETRRFWTTRGFLPLIELDIWETDAALLQVRAIDGAGPHAASERS